ncbi:putative metal-dependent hydrolase [Methylophaga frappieri]|uniref:Putative metal-dependent hydrolase n=1 Tax=Methylophaga frappieri (strain ATCC BAA-2434 / DSM 25690 / JAM7) TaxID=754477 RepID=I1YIU5_METFJ|nr:SprT family zinc-dependent metalloprotease [Methylophaga frappieri]AFJ02838.1 putative metal-dependent hydrolase [Methylophaga frappieri]
MFRKKTHQPPQLFFENQPVSIRRDRRRKSVAIKVTDNRISLHLPWRCPLSLGEKFLEQKQEWLKNSLKKQLNQPVRRYNNNSQQPYLGQSLQLRFKPQLTSSFILNDEQIQLKLPTDSDQRIAKNKLSEAYQTLATDYLPQRGWQIAKKTGLMPARFRVRYYKSRWGSCHAGGEIRLNWQLVQAPISVIDYVLIHELCHLQEMNHSPAFWRLVGEQMPDFKIQRQWLKQQGHTLLF